MSNVISGYRMISGLTQREMAKILDIEEVTYRLKEKGKSEFKRSEMIAFTKEVKKMLPKITVQDIFFNE